MPEDPRILTREEWAQESLLQSRSAMGFEHGRKLSEHDLAQRERIATLEARVRELESAPGELEVWLCPPHRSLDDARKLEPLGNCVACIRAQRNEMEADNRQLRAAAQFVLDHIADPKRDMCHLYPAFGLNASRAIELLRAALHPAGPHGKDGNGEHLRDANKLVHPTACDLSGKCEARMGATGTTNCIHCGKELIQRADGNWYTWDAPEGGGLPQYQATAAPQLSGEAGEKPAEIYACNSVTCGLIGKHTDACIARHRATEPTTEKQG